MAATAIASHVLQCLVPPSTKYGWVNVEVTNRADDQLTAAGVVFLYVQSAIISVSPASGPSHGGTIISLRGLGLVFPLVCVDDTTRALPTTYESASFVSCQMPSQSRIGLVLLQLRSFGAFVAGHVFFEYFDDVSHMQSMHPAFGPSRGGTLITISGSGTMQMERTCHPLECSRCDA